MHNFDRNSGIMHFVEHCDIQGWVSFYIMPCVSQLYVAPAAEHHSLPVKLISAGLGACIADLITYPLDMAKVRLQVTPIWI